LRAVLFCNEMLGLGHLRRSLVLASALVSSEDDSTALVITGSHGVGTMPVPPRVDVMKLPTAPVTAESQWRKTELSPPASLAIEPSVVRELRAQLSLTALRELRPDVVLVDFMPLGRNEELRPALEWLRAEGEATVALGQWEVADSPDQQRWTPELIAEVRELYDIVILYGEASADDVRVARLRAAGIPVATTDVVGLPPADVGPSDLEPGYLLVTAGGGADGHPLLDTTLAAIRARPLPISTVLVAGPMMPASKFAHLQDAAVDLDVQVQRVRSDMDALLAGARAVVSMAGYSTVAEVLASGKPSLLVPRAFPRDEQLRRARRWAAAGRADLLEPDALSPASLRAAIERLIERPDRPRKALTGAHDAVRLLAAASQRRALNVHLQAAPVELA
jgi:predicted glycosyltransferase